MFKLADSHTLVSVVFVFTALAVTALVAFIVGVRGEAGSGRGMQRETPGAGVMDMEATGDAVHAEKAAHRQGSPRPAPSPETPIEQAIRGAVNALQPVTGIEALESALKQPEWSDDERARLHLALARLADSMQPPDAARAEASFTMAASLAQSSATLAELARTRAELLMNRKEYSPAIVVVRETLEELPPAAPERVSLQLFLGSLLELNQEASVAESLYREVMEQVRTQPGEWGPDYLRQTALQLSRLLRASGREQEADELAKSISKELSIQEQHAAGADGEHGDDGGGASATESHGSQSHESSATDPKLAPAESHAPVPQGEPKPAADPHGH